VDFRTPEPSKAHLHALLFLREAYERRPKMVKFNGEQFDYLENAIHASQTELDEGLSSNWDNDVMTTPSTPPSMPPPFSSASNSTITPVTTTRPRVVRPLASATQPELMMTPITPTASMNCGSTMNFGTAATSAEQNTSKVNVAGEPAPMIMPYGVTFLKGEPIDDVFVSKSQRHGNATPHWPPQTLQQYQEQQYQQQMQLHFITHQPSPLTPRNLHHHQENQKPTRSPTSPRKSGGTKRPSGHSTAPTDMATNPSSRQRPRIQVSTTTNSTPFGFPQSNLNSAGALSSGSAGSARGFQLDDVRLSKQLASLEVRGESMSPSSTTRTHPPHGLPLPSIHQTQSQPFVVPSQAHLFPDRSCQDVNSNSWDTSNFWTNGIVSDDSELTW